MNEDRKPLVEWTDRRRGTVRDTPSTVTVLRDYHPRLAILAGRETVNEQLMADVRSARANSENFRDVLAREYPRRPNMLIAGLIVLAGTIWIAAMAYAAVVAF